MAHPRMVKKTGSGANSGRQGVRLGSARLSELRWAQAASAAFHHSDIVAFRPVLRKNPVQRFSAQCNAVRPKDRQKVVDSQAAIPSS
jgi:hypothetical protein